MTGYNGWTNWATWNVELWLDNDEPLYREKQRWIRRQYREIEGDDVRRWCIEIFPHGTPDMKSAIEEAFRRKYPGADVDVIVVPNQYGGGKLRVWEEAADGSELPPHECSVDVDAVRDHLAYIAERLFETAGA